MGRKKQSEREKRKIIQMWLDTAAGLDKEDTLYVPMRHIGARQEYMLLGKQIISDIESSFDNSIYHGIVLYGTSKRGMPYLAIKKPKIITTVGYLHNKQRTLQLMVKSKHTRKAQIMLLLTEGFSKEEIIGALGTSITPQEKVILDFIGNKKIEKKS